MRTTTQQEPSGQGHGLRQPPGRPRLAARRCKGGFTGSAAARARAPSLPAPARTVTAQGRARHKDPAACTRVTEKRRQFMGSGRVASPPGDPAPSSARPLCPSLGITVTGPSPGLRGPALPSLAGSAKRLQSGAPESNPPGARFCFKCGGGKTKNKREEEEILIRCHLHEKTHVQTCWFRHYRGWLGTSDAKTHRAAIRSPRPACPPGGGASRCEPGYKRPLRATPHNHRKTP